MNGESWNPKGGGGGGESNPACYQQQQAIKLLHNTYKEHTSARSQHVPSPMSDLILALCGRSNWMDDADVGDDGSHHLGQHNPDDSHLPVGPGIMMPWLNISERWNMLPLGSITAKLL